MPRSNSNGSVRAAFWAVTFAVGSTTSSASGPRQAARICSASDSPPAGDQPLKTTAATGSEPASTGSRTSCRQRALIR